MLFCVMRRETEEQEGSFGGAEDFLRRWKPTCPKPALVLVLRLLPGASFWLHWMHLFICFAFPR